MEKNSRKRCEIGLKTWAEVERTAVGREKWKDTINGPSLPVGVI